MGENDLKEDKVEELEESVIKKRLLLSTFIIIVFPGAFIFFVISAIFISKFTGIAQDRLVIGSMAAFALCVFLFAIIFTCAKLRGAKKDAGQD